MSLPRFYEGLWELSTTEVARSVDWVREGYVHCVVREGISPRKVRVSALLADIGCGTGAYVREFSGALNSNYVGVDVSANALRECKRELSAEEESRCSGLIQGDSARLPLASSSVDLLFCAHVLEHVPEDEATFRELHRILTKDGYVRLIVPNSLDKMWPLFRPLERRLGSLGHLREYTSDILTQQLTTHRFMIHRIGYSDFFFAWALFRLEETMRSMTRRSGLARRMNKLVSQRRIACRVFAVLSESAIYWENRFLKRCSWGMNICCIAQRVE